MTSPLESLVLDGLSLNDGTAFDLEAFEFNPAAKRQRWISGDDADGDVLAEPSRAGNRPATITLRVAPQASMDLALAKIGQIQDKLYEAEQQPDGLALVWTPHDATKQATAYVLSGEITDLPITLDAGWFANAPSITLRLDCLPYMEGAEVTSAATVTNTDPIQLLTVSGVTGDVPAKARLVVTDAATQSRRHVEWGLQWRYYDAATSLLLDSDSLVTSGFSGTGTTRTGAYDNPVAGNNVIRGTLTNSTPVAVCGTGAQSHVGTFLVKARVYVATSATLSYVYVRLSWQEGDGPFHANDYVGIRNTTAIRGWQEISLGTITVPAKTLGTQRWTGRIEAYSATSGDTIDVDYVELIPTSEGYGKARGIQQAESLTSFTARDEFNQAAGNLNAVSAPVGGAWATSGSATDLAVEATGHTLTRAATGTRYAISGAAAATAQLAQVDFMTTSDYTGSNAAMQGVIGRWTDASNYFFVTQSVYQPTPTTYNTVIYVRKVVGGVTTFLDFVVLPIFANLAWYTLRIVVEADGNYAVWYARQGYPLGVAISVGRDSDLATGGTLASGKVGIYDFSSGALARYYDNFFAGTPTSQAVVFSGRAAEIRHDGAIRQDSTGTYYGPVRSYRGAHFYLPPSGDESRTSRILVKARRNDIDVAQDDQIADSTTATIHYTPRYSSVPR